MLVGNKVDLNLKREVEYDEAHKFATDNGILYTETSAKLGFGVKEAFYDACKVIKRRVEEKTIDVENLAYGITVKKKPEPKPITVSNVEPKKKCCM